MKHLKKFENYSEETIKNVVEKWNTKDDTNWYSDFIEAYPTMLDFQNELADELNGEEWYAEAEFYMLGNQVGKMSESVTENYPEFYGDLVDTEWSDERMDEEEYDEIMNGFPNDTEDE
jgi:hypothetical protein